MFKAILVEKDDAGYRTQLTTCDESSLPQGKVLVRVAYSTLNYKDALAITGKSPQQGQKKSFSESPEQSFCTVAPRLRLPLSSEAEKLFLAPARARSGRWPRLLLPRRGWWWAIS
jgi:hypothetical protein